MEEAEVVRSVLRFLRHVPSEKRHLYMSDEPDERVRSMLEVGRVLGKIEQGMSAAAIATPRGPVIVRIGVAAAGGHTVEAPGAEPVHAYGHGLAVVLYEALVAAGGPVVPESIVDRSNALAVLWGIERESEEPDEDLLGRVAEAAEKHMESMAAQSPAERLSALAKALLHGPRTPTVLDEQEADALAGEIVARLRDGRGLGDLPECGITIEETKLDWRISRDGTVVAVVPIDAVDSWGRLRAEIARLLRG